ARGLPRKSQPKTRCPSGLNATAVTVPLCPSRVALSWPVVASHRRTVLPPALARMSPSGLNATDRTASVCPCRVVLRCPVLTSHNRTVLSSEPLARVRPSGLIARVKTLAVCPWRVARAWPVLTSHSRTSPRWLVSPDRVSTVTLLGLYL